LVFGLGPNPQTPNPQSPIPNNRISYFIKNLEIL
jgi:hypothetical protein